MKATIDELTMDIKIQAEKKLVSKLGTYVSELEKITLTSKSEKIKTDTLIYLINRTLGTPTNKIADVTDKDDQDIITMEQLEDEFTKFKTIKEA